MQENKPIAFYSRKLNIAQKCYTTGEQELLSIVETLKEFRNILLGQKLIVHTDHKNLLYNKLANDRMIRWRLLLEEYDPTFEHVKGNDNVIADALSRLDADFSKEPLGNTEEELAQAFVGEGEEEDAQFPLQPLLVAKYQEKDKKLKKKMKEKPSDFSTISVEGQDLITHKNKIYIPEHLQLKTVAWYHEYLEHPGETRTDLTLRQHFTWPGLKTHVVRYCKSCPECQKAKQVRKKYGKLPPKVAEAIPWERV